jgi:hypothetical protein
LGASNNDRKGGGGQGRPGRTDLNKTAPPLSLSAMVEQLAALVNADAALLRRGRDLTIDIMIEIDDEPYYVAIEHGRIVGVQRGPAIMKSWAFAVRGEAEAWEKFWQPVPPPNFHDIFALAKLGAFRIEGDYRPLITNLLYFKALLAAPRALRMRGG